jgi:hypothetical protein
MSGFSTYLHRYIPICSKYLYSTMLYARLHITGELQLLKGCNFSSVGKAVIDQEILGGIGVCTYVSKFQSQSWNLFANQVKVTKCVVVGGNFCHFGIKQYIRGTKIWCLLFLSKRYVRIQFNNYWWDFTTGIPIRRNFTKKPSGAYPTKYDVANLYTHNYKFVKN